MMSDDRPAPETKGVAVELLGTVDLGPEIEGLEGRQLRMRMVTIEPGGVFGPLHDHVGRPGTVYVLQGTITDHRNGVVTDYPPGVGWPEDRDTTHWLENRGTVPAVEISVDIVKLARTESRPPTRPSNTIDFTGRTERVLSDGSSAPAGGTGPRTGGACCGRADVPSGSAIAT